MLVLDAGSSTRVSVLSTREPIAAWERELLDFPSPSVGEFGYEPNEVLTMRLKKELVGISPGPIMNEAGEMERGWRCPSLLRAMYLMLYFDTSGGNTIRQCRRGGARLIFRGARRAGANTVLRSVLA